MKEIKLKRITLVNFKGIQNLTLNFKEQETTICGANGTGKTTIFDAFTWLLFGKDSQDRKDFNIKTYGKDGNTIPKLPHEVSAIVEVDGVEVALRKAFAEKWTKRRGALEEVFDGHETLYYYNDVPLKASEYNERIADICSEQTFKYITNPLYFTSQKPDVQRQLLFRLAGDITNEEVLAKNKDNGFEEVVNALSGKSIDDLRREIAAKKRTIKSDCENIPARIDERRRSISEPKDWSAIEKQIADLGKQIAEINMQIADRTKAYDIVTEQKQKKAKEISELRLKATQQESDLRAKLLADYYAAKSKHDAAVSQSKIFREDRRSATEKQAYINQQLNAMQIQRNDLLSEWKQIQEEAFSVSDDKFICPTCKRPLDADDIAAQKSEMERNFNTDKVRRLEENKQQGLAIKNRIESLTAQLKQTQNAIFDLDIQIGAVESSQEFIEPQMPNNIESVIASDKGIAQINAKIQELQAEMDSEVSVPNCDDLLERKNALESEVQSAKIELSSRGAIEANNIRIAVLEDEYNKLQAALAELEKTEYNINQFNKARMQAVEERVNSMFRIVKFKLFDTLVNGSEVEVCEAMVNGVPFGTQNNAMKLNIGLDIINTICEKEEISAPIVIDNRESVTEIVAPTHSQIINLQVNADYKQLTII